MIVIPTVFSKNKKGFEKRFEHLRKASKYLQIDFMDGKFVSTKGLMPKDVFSLKKYSNSVEAHLMTKEPEKQIQLLAKLGFKKIIFHYEAFRNNEDILNTFIEIKKYGLKPVLAINPETKYSSFKNLLYAFSIVQLMGVKPGKEHQKFDSKVFNKIKKIKKNHPKLKIQVDGGVNVKNAAKLQKAGVDILNSGSYVYESKNPKKAIKELKNG